MSKSEQRQVELHTHSTASDGQSSPKEIAELCSRHGVDVWALTDHDNCEGCRAGQAAADRLGLEFVPGIEISAYLERSIHVLGYGIEPEASAIAKLIDRLRRERRERMAEMVDELRDRGVEISLQTVRREANGAPLSRSHLAQVLVDADSVTDADEAFERYIGRDGPAYVPVGWPSVPTAISRIHRAGGAAILAHPGRYEVDQYIPDWIDAGLDGIEVGHPDHESDDERRYRELAKSHGLIATESSDFHGRRHRSWEHFGETKLGVEKLEALFGTINRYP